MNELLLAHKTWTHQTASRRYMVYILRQDENFTVRYVLIHEGEKKSGPHGLVTFSSLAAAEAFAMGLIHVIKDLCADSGEDPEPAMNA